MLNLNQDQLKKIEQKIEQFESNTGCELLVVVTDASDPYPAASFRFAFLASAVFSLVSAYYLEFENQTFWPVFIFSLFLFFILLGRFNWAKKIALSSIEVERECHEKSIELFHSLGTQEVDHKVTAMIMISLLERKIKILVDKKISEKVSNHDLNVLILIMTKYFKQKDFSSGISLSIESFESKIIEKFSGKVTEIPPQKLSNAIHFRHL